jgi:hypothetical protein
MASTARHENDDVLTIELLREEPPEPSKLEVPFPHRQFGELDLDPKILANVPQRPLQ